MRPLRAWFLRLTSLFNTARRDADLDGEIESHLQMHMDDNLRAGMSPEEARRIALIRLGGIEQTKLNYRDRRGIPFLEHFFQDVRYGVRMLRKSPVFTFVAVLTLALGIGGNSVMFSFVSAVFLRPLPVTEPEQLVSVRNSRQRSMFPTFSYPNYRDLRDQNNVLAELYALRFAPVGVTHEGVNQRVWSNLVTGNYFVALGLRPSLGRLFTPEDDLMVGAHPVTVLSFDSWKNRFGAQPDIVGKPLLVNGRTYTIIGVAPKGFHGTANVAAPEIWFTMSMNAAIDASGDITEIRGAEIVMVQGRLKPGVNLARAQAELNSIGQNLARDYPDVNEGMAITLASMSLIESRRVVAIGFAALLMAVVALVLLLACVNLANLLLARATERREEIALRLALGASRMRLVRQLLTESLLLAGAGGLLGMLPALWPLNLRIQLRPPADIPLALDVPWDYRVFLFTALLTLITGIAFGLVPALHATKAEVSPVLKGAGFLGGRRRSWVRGGLIVVQVAVSIVLLVGGGLMLRSLSQAHAYNLGFVPEGAVEVTFDLRLQGYDDPRGREFQSQLLERVRALPAVDAAGIADLVPVDLHFSRTPVLIEGQAPQSAANTPTAYTSRITPGYLRAMGTPLIAGRDFTEDDRPGSVPVVIVNQAFAKKFWPGEDPIGKQLRRNPSAPPLQVIGIAQDSKYTSLTEDPTPFIFRSLLQSYSGASTLVVRGKMDALPLVAAIRREIAQLDSQMPLASAGPLAGRLDIALLPARVAASVLGVFALLGLLLAAIGIYGVISYAVSRRIHEVGIRLALGARPADVLKLIIVQGMRPAFIGALIGLPLAFALTRLMRTLLFGVSATDPLTYFSVVVLLGAVALLACYIPARRATRIDPMAALRYE